MGVWLDSLLVSGRGGVCGGDAVFLALILVSERGFESCGRADAVGTCVCATVCVRDLKGEWTEQTASN